MAEPSLAQPASGIHAESENVHINTPPQSPLAHPAAKASEPAYVGKNSKHGQNSYDQTQLKLPSRSAAQLQHPESDKEANPHTVALKERFQFARAQQEKREQKRLQNFKLDPRHSISSVQEVKPGQVGYESPKSKAFVEQFRTKQATPNTLWSGALEDMKTKQDARHGMIRSQTEKFGRQVNAMSVATSRIPAWEQQFIQTPTAKDLAIIWRKARGYFQLSLQDQISYRSDSGEDHILVMGHVKLLPFECSEQCKAYMMRSLASRAKYVGLAVSIVRTKSTKPNIKISVMATKLASGDYCLLMLAGPAPGYEYDRTLEGRYKITLYDHKKTIKLFENEIEVRFFDSQDAANVIAPIEQFADLTEEQEDIDDEDLATSAEESALRASLDRRSSEDSADVPIDGDTEDALGAMVNAESNDTEHHEQDTDHHHSLLDDEDSTLILDTFQPSDYIPYEEQQVSEQQHQEREAAEAPSETSVSRERNSSGSSADSEPHVPNMELASRTWQQEANVRGTSLSLSQGFIQLDVRYAEAIFPADRLFVVTGNHQNALVASSMKITAMDSKFVVQNNQAFEWIHGVALSGYLKKFPAAAGGWGTPVRRFFVLKDNRLTYFNSRPQGDIFAESQLDKPCKTFAITKDTKIEVIVASIFRCLKITFPRSNKTLWIKMRSGSRKEPIWRNALEQTIALQASKHQSVSTTLKTMWFNEGQNFELIAVDAFKSPDGYLKVALFKSLNSGNVLDGYGNVGVEQGYFVDVTTNECETVHLQLLRTNEKPLSMVELHCVKIYGDKLIFGGCDGQLFVGVIGRTTDVSRERGKKVLYCIPCIVNITVPDNVFSSGISTAATGKASSTAGSVDRFTMVDSPHVPGSDIRFLAWESSSNIFAALDDCRILSFWHLAQYDMSSNGLLDSPSKKRPGFYYGIKPDFQSSFDLERTDPAGIYTQEKVLALYFLSENGHLIVSTSMRLLLLLVTFEPRRQFGIELDCRFGVNSYVELDRVEPGYTGLFGIQLIDPQHPYSDTGDVTSAMISAAAVSGPTKGGSPGKPEEKQVMYKSHVTGLEKMRRVVLWRFIGLTHAEASKVSGKPPQMESLCQASRTEWSEEKFLEALKMVKHV